MLKLESLTGSLVFWYGNSGPYFGVSILQESTIGAAFFSKTLAVNDETVKFEIWDTAGQERYHSLAPMYYRGAAAAVILYDITNSVSKFDKIEAEFFYDKTYLFYHPYNNSHKQFFFPCKPQD